MFNSPIQSARTMSTWLVPALALCTFSNSAFAEEPAAAPEAAPAAAPTESNGPSMNFSVAPPSPTLQRTDYLHEGFYFRFNLGPGIAHSNLGQGPFNVSGGGFALGADLLIGGSPAPGVVFGGGVFTNTLVAIPYAPTTKQTQFQFIAGPFFDVYPRNKGGFHFGAGLGFAGSTLDSIPGGPAFGGGGALFTGYDAWIAPDWSAGFLIRGSGAYMAGNDVNTSSFGLMAMLTLVRN